MKDRSLADGEPGTASERPAAIDLVRESDFSAGMLRVRPSSHEVVMPTGTEAIEPRVMQVLVALFRRRGEVVSRHDLVAACWAGRVVGDDAISRCIVRVRRLGEASGAFSVETIARTGYRLTENARATTEPDRSPSTAEKELALATVALAAQAPRNRRRRLVFATCVVAVLAAAFLFEIAHQRELTAGRAQRDRAVREIENLVQKDQFSQAFTLAAPLRHDVHLAIAERLRKAWRQIVLPMRPLVSEDGATVFFKSYEDEKGEWLKAGITPLSQPVDAPRGVLRIKVEKQGFRTGYFVVANPGPSVVNEPPNQSLRNRGIAPVPLPLVAENTLPEGMVLVPHTNMPVTLSGWTSDIRGSFQFDIPAFAIGRDEVTNQEFKEFIDAGGYDNPAWWQELKFEEDGRELSWAEARRRFVDSTSRPGPAEWQLSTYPKGQADFPVGGISWYEAMAYARFRGESLPTIHHWVRAAFAPYDSQFNTSPQVSLLSRFSTAVPVSARADTGLGPWGTHNMAGNAREWVWNRAGSKGLALGGVWSDYASESREAYTAPPMQRLAGYGLRLMRNLTATPLTGELLQPVQLAVDDPGRARNPVSDEAFEAMRFQFPRAHVKPLAVTVTEVERSSLWFAEEVVLTLPDNRLATLYVIRPKARGTRLQPIIYAPPGNCCAVKRPNRSTLEQLEVSEFIVNSGRMLVMPIWELSYERYRPQEIDPNAVSDRQRLRALGWQQDLMTTLDYLESRDDVDMSKAGYLGFSLGAGYIPITLAIEDRIRAAVLVSGGIVLTQSVHPMSDLVNYAPHIRIPVLMINGRYDHSYLYEASQQRLFDLLGTPAADKAHIVYETGHYNYPLNSLARESSNWFDKYLGTVH